MSEYTFGEAMEQGRESGLTHPAGIQNLGALQHKLQYAVKWSYFLRIFYLKIGCSNQKQQTRQIVSDSSTRVYHRLRLVWQLRAGSVVTYYFVFESKMVSGAADSAGLWQHRTGDPHPRIKDPAKSGSRVFQKQFTGQR